MRIQVDLTPERVARLKALMAVLELDGYKDLFNNALSVLDWVVEETRNGREVASIDAHEQRYRVLVLPALEPVASAGRIQANGNGHSATPVPERTGRP